MSERFMATVQAEALSRELATALSMHPVPGSRYRVIVEEIDETDEEKQAMLRAALQKGHDDIAAGRFIDGKASFEELAEKHFPNRIK